MMTMTACHRAGLESAPHRQSRMRKTSLTLTRGFECGLLLLMIIVAGARPTSAQSSSWPGLPATNPPGITYTLTLETPGPFREMEMIAGTLNFQLDGAEADREAAGDIWGFGGLLVDPRPDLPGSPSPSCFDAEPFCRFRMTSWDAMGGITDGRSFRERSPSEILITKHIKALPPGEYRVAALAQKQVVIGKHQGATIYGVPSPPVYAVSNTVRVRIVPATEAWVQTTASQARATIMELSSPVEYAQYEKRNRAVHQLALLDGPAAWRIQLASAGEANGMVISRMADTQQPAALCELLQQRISMPEQHVGGQYLNAMGTVCSRAHLPPAPTDPGAAARPSPEQVEHLRQSIAYSRSLHETYGGRLLHSLNLKSPKAQLAGLEALLLISGLYREPNPTEGRPNWYDSLPAEFARLLPALPDPRQMDILSSFVEAFPGFAWVPVLEEELGRWTRDTRNDIGVTFRLLFALDPNRASRLVAAEVNKPESWVSPAVIALVSKDTLGMNDEALVSALEEDISKGSWHRVPWLYHAVARFASAEMLPRVKAVYAHTPAPCNVELLAYFARVDPEHAAGMLPAMTSTVEGQRGPQDSATPELFCRGHVLSRLPAIHISPVVERYLIAHLNQPSVHLKAEAALSLRLYGSAKAEEALTAAFRYFHQYWKGRKEELEANREGVRLEATLIESIGRGRAWHIDAARLEALGALCISDDCRAMAERLLAELQQPIEVHVYASLRSFQGWVGPVVGLGSMADMAQHLRLLPRGTRVKINAHGKDSDALRQQLENIAAAQGLVLQSP
ncbi:MAG: hypothetical protein KIT83_16765 [Bryobacterales bacterium]|nr:hypothetical protein [Bryobacterales bacterium]